MLGTGLPKTLALSQSGSTIQTQKNGKLKHLVHHQEEEKKGSSSYFAKQKTAPHSQRELSKQEKMSKLGQAKESFVIL